MKKLFIFFLFAFAFCGCKSQNILYKKVNGIKVEFSASDYIQYRLDSLEFVKNDSIQKADSVDATTSFAPIITAFQPMVGKTFSQLTAAQKTNMVEAIMWKLGIINRHRIIKSLDKWLLKQ